MKNQQINKGNEPKRRLSNFRIKEVSVVDEAANERKFLIVKSKESENKDKDIFKKEEENKQPKPQQSTNKNVEPLTFAALVMSSDDILNRASNFYSEIKALKVNENGNYTMGPELTGQAVSMLEKISDMLYLFGSENTLGFAEEAFMSVAKYFNKSKNIDIKKIGRPMNASRLKALENGVDVLETGLSTIKELLHELKYKEEQMKKEELLKKETELQKRMKEEEAKIRKELGLEENVEDKEGDEKPPIEPKNEDKDETQEEIAKLKKENEQLKKEKEDLLNKSKEDKDSSKLEEIEKRLKSLESAPESKSESDSENEEVNKNKIEYVEKNGRKVRKDLWKGLRGRPLSDVLDAQSKKY